MQTITAALAFLLERDLERLVKELEAFRQEENLWKTAGHITNTTGNLCLHLAGNLHTYIGAVLGSSGYVRNREAEFSLKDIPRAELIRQVQNTKAVVAHTMASVTDEQLQQPYPQQVLGYEMTTGFFLVHLTGHLSYHLGQINYLRRILE
ncbi:DinB superfamily protein [Pontibacter sp. HJ8]